jgi:riboflavin kinase/FMN adenylyltransferase
MKIVETPSELQKIKKDCVLTIGNFDGVHLGHQEIIKEACNRANQKSTELTVMTFEPHPVAVLFPEKAPGVLTPLELKINLLKHCDVDNLVILKVNSELLNLSHKNFVERFLVENIKPSTVVEGGDFNFGAGRTGNIDALKELGVKNGFKVSVVKPRMIKLSSGQMVRVSSTMIRYMLESGHVADAAEALGRPYRLIEEIIPGRGIGKKLGFPTLNMKIPEQVIPSEGVYAGFVRMGKSIQEILSSEETFPAVYSIGQARTYGDENPLLIEAHLLEEDVTAVAGDFMAMDFIHRIRSQHKFQTPEKLSSQIAKDCERAREYFNLRF